MSTAQTLTGWLPIETAPKDSNKPLLLGRFDGSGNLTAFDPDGLWMRERESWEQSREYCFWASANGIHEPTHWMYQPEWFTSLRTQPSQHLLEAERYRAIITALWNIIDDIDTYGDMAKADDAAFRKLVERRQGDRWKTGITTDGYTLNIDVAGDVR